MSQTSPRKVLITGASKGIGRACALSFAGLGDKLIVNIARSADKLQEVAEQCRHAGATSVELVPADLGTDSARIACAEETGPVDILVNNAGAIRGGGLFDMHLEEWRQSWELKIFGYLHMCQLYGLFMKAQKSGIIVNIIGIAGMDLRPDYICGFCWKCRADRLYQSPGGRNAERECAGIWH